MAKKDVSEFVTTLQSDTTQIVAETADTLKTKLTVSEQFQYKDRMVSI